MENDVADFGPFTLEMKVQITDGGENVGEVTFSFAPGRLPDAATIDRAISECAKQAKAHGYRLMNRHEFVRAQIGIECAVPGPKEFPNAKFWNK